MSYTKFLQYESQAIQSTNHIQIQSFIWQIRPLCDFSESLKMFVRWDFVLELTALVVSSLDENLLNDHFAENYQFWTMSNPKEIKNSAYFKSQIQQKVSQIVGLIGLDLPLPPWFQIAKTSEHQQTEQFDSEVEYFIVDSYEPLTESISQKIRRQAKELIKSDVNFSKKCKQAPNQMTELFVHLQTNEKLATVTVFCFQLQNLELVRVKNWKKQSQKELSCDLQEILQAAVCYQFTGLKFNQILITHHQTVINIEAGKTTFTLVCTRSDSTSSSPNRLLNQIKHNILTQSLMLEKFVYSPRIMLQLRGCNFEAEFFKQRWQRKVEFLHYCCQELKLTLKQMSLVRAKPALYVKNICQLVAEYVQSSLFISHQIQKYVSLILEQAEDQKIFQYFYRICLQIGHRKESAKGGGTE